MKQLVYYSVIIGSLLFSACGDSTETNTNAKGNTANANTPANSAKRDPLAAQTATPEATNNNAPTLTPVYKAYCAASEKKDEAALRSVHDTATIKDYERKMKADGIATLTEFLSDDAATTALCEVRNEKIAGDVGTAEVRTKVYPNGAVAVFVKENGEWKLTNRRPEGALK